MAKVEEHPNFCNKLWNAACYVCMNAENQDLAAAGAEFSLADRWISSRLKDMLARIEAGFADYRLDAVANALYQFTWHEFCDWYVQLSKAVLQSDSASQGAKCGTRMTLVKTLQVCCVPCIRWRRSSRRNLQRVRRFAGVSGENISRAWNPRAESMTTMSGPSRWVTEEACGGSKSRGEIGYPLERASSKVPPRCWWTAIFRVPGAVIYVSTRLVESSAARAQAGRKRCPSLRGLLRNLEILVPMKTPIDPAAAALRAGKKLRKAEVSLSKLEAKKSWQQPVCQEYAPPDRPRTSSGSRNCARKMPSLSAKLPGRPSSSNERVHLHNRKQRSLN